MAVGAVFGQQGASWGPEVLLGYRDVISKDDGRVMRAALKSESPWGAVAIEGGAEVRGSLTIYDLKLAVHLMF